MSAPRTFKIEAFLKSREARYISLEKSVAVDNMVFSPLETQKNRIKVSFTIEAYSEEEAKDKAQKLLNSICAAFLLDTNVAMRVDDIDIVEVREPHVAKAGKMVVIGVHKIVRLKDEVVLGVAIGESHLKHIFEKAKRMRNLDERLIRFLRWYAWALLEDDPIDKFAHLWIALEIWAEYKGYKKGKEGEKAKMTNTLVHECGVNEEDAEKMYIIRSKLFHSGIYTEAVEKLPQLEQCLMSILSKIKHNIFT